MAPFDRLDSHLFLYLLRIQALTTHAQALIRSLGISDKVPGSIPCKRGIIWDRSRVNTCNILGSIPNWIDPVLSRVNGVSVSLP